MLIRKSILLFKYLIVQHNGVLTIKNGELVKHQLLQNHYSDYS
jgi:hypothetical protein